MPLFIFVSGYFAKRVRASKIINLLLVYLIFQTLYSAMLSLSSFQFKFDYAMPFFHLWYLLSMIVWYIIALGITKIKNYQKYGLAFIIFFLLLSISSRYFTSDVTNAIQTLMPSFYEYTFSYQRTLSFAFFFFLGFFLDKTTMDSLKNVIKPKLVVSIISVIGIGLFIWIANNHNLEMIFRGPFGIDDFVDSSFPSLALILISYVLSTYICFLLINVVSDKVNTFTRWGDQSLQIFLFHAIAVFVLMRVPQLNNLPSMALLIVLFILSLAIVYVLSHPLFVRYTDFLCNPYKAIKQLKTKSEAKTHGVNS